ncbi:hypothetical protein Bbelb_227940 [Branchiostoma belcheri]|nr:hypothetical protein Bbelb_227940 [Branchiostoma belcheri]
MESANATWSVDETLPIRIFGEQELIAEFEKAGGRALLRSLPKQKCWRSLATESVNLANRPSESRPFTAQRCAKYRLLSSESAGADMAAARIRNLVKRDDAHRGVDSETGQKKLGHQQVDTVKHGGGEGRGLRNPCSSRGDRFPPVLITLLPSRSPSRDGGVMSGAPTDPSRGEPPITRSRKIAPHAHHIRNGAMSPSVTVDIAPFTALKRQVRGLGRTGCRIMTAEMSSIGQKRVIDLESRVKDFYVLDGKTETLWITTVYSTTP